MPVVFTFDYDTEHRDDNDYARLKSMFERFGWQSLGGTSYRYPFRPHKYLKLLIIDEADRLKLGALEVI